MADLIERDKAIDAVEHITSSMSVCVNSDECHGMKRMQRQAVIELTNLPSAQPVTINENGDGLKLQSSNDTISRQAAIEAVETKIKKWNAVDGEGYHVGLGLKYTDVIDTLTELPSAQPELNQATIPEDRCGECDAWNKYKNYPSAQLAQDLTKGCTDTISRQAAIEALDGNVKVTSRESAQAVMDYIRECADRIRSLPSAQPEPDTRLYTDGFADGYRQGQKDAQPEQQWIPCSVEQPTIDGKYHVTVESYGMGRYVTELWYGKPTLPMNGSGGKRGWFDSTPDGDYWCDGVVAWRELPEPWKGEQHDS